MIPQALIFMHNPRPFPTLREMLRKIIIRLHIFYEVVDMAEVSASRYQNTCHGVVQSRPGFIVANDEMPHQIKARHPDCFQEFDGSRAILRELGVQPLPLRSLARD